MRSKNHRVAQQALLWGRQPAAMNLAPPDRRSIAPEKAEIRFPDQEIKPVSKVLMRHTKPGEAVGALWDRMLGRDTVLRGLVNTRATAALCLPVMILPRSPHRRAESVAEFCAEVVSRIPRFETNARHQYERVTHQWRLEEIVWQSHSTGTLANRWSVDLIDREQAHFAYLKRRGGPVLFKRLKNGQYKKVPTGKAIVGATGTKANPWGSGGLLEEIFWAWFATEFGWRYYMSFIETFATPKRRGTYRPTGNNSMDGQSVAILWQAIDAFQQDMGFVLPEGLTVDLIESARSGNPEFSRFLEMANHAKSLVILGQAGISGLEKGGGAQGSYKKLDILNQVRIETVRLDCQAMDEHWTRNLLYPLVLFNFGQEVAERHLPMWYTEAVSAENLAMRQERLDKVFQHGAPIPVETFYRTNMLRIPRAGEKVIQIVNGELQVRDLKDAEDLVPGEGEISTESETKRQLAYLHHWGRNDLNRFSIRRAA